jgi:hypothetical protein
MFRLFHAPSGACSSPRGKFALLIGTADGTVGSDKVRPSGAASGGTAPEGGA